jgi:hypothetical protein
MTDDEVQTLIGEQSKFQLATINRDGTPHLVTMFSGLVEDKIAFWTYRTSRKAYNLARDSRVTCMIETGTDYFELRPDAVRHRQGPDRPERRSVCWLPSRPPNDGSRG